MRWILLFLSVIGYCNGVEWNELFKRHRLSGESLILRQYDLFIASQSMTVANPSIKTIPIEESGEPCIDLRQIPGRISMLPDPDAPFASPDCNSGMPSASRVRMGVFNKLEAMVEALDALAEEFGYERGQVEIRVFEALRDLATQEKLFQNKWDEIRQAHPLWTDEEIDRETAKWVSPVKNNVPVHSTGAAVDLRLWDAKNDRLLDMGPFGVIWGKNENAPTFSENISSEQKRNRLYSLMAAERAGLTNYSFEFWHFSSDDRYDAYWKGSGRALYGPISN
jgi:D-alanyl-D-alanine dipeptidase